MFKIMVCGAGGRGLEHLQFIQKVEALQLTGIFDISATALQAAQRVANVPGSQQLDPLFHSNPPDIVVVATPPHVRLALIEQIARYPEVKAVIIEKPVALTAAEAQKIACCCQQSGIVPFVFHQLRFCPEFIKLKEAIQSGQLGQLRSLQAYCAGNLFDQGTHMLDIVRWLAGNRAVDWVMSQGCNQLPTLARFKAIPPHFQPDQLHPGSAWSVTTFGLAGSVEATLHAGLLNPIEQPQVGPWLQKRVVAIGDQGLAEAQTAVHFKLLNSQSAGWHIEKSDLSQYVQAQVDVYHAVLDTLANDAPPFLPITDAIYSLEVLEACLVSEEQGTLVPVSSIQTYGEQLENGPAAATAGTDRPIVSIIIPLDRHFGWAEAAITSWTDQQRCLPGDYEVIALTEPDKKDLAEAVRCRLRPQDKLICQTTAGEIEKYHLGAMQAAGEILFFTEPHCLAEPETVREIVDFCKHHSTDGFCVRSTSLVINSLTARLEARMFAEYFVEWSKADNWQKAFLRGLGLRRDVYFAVGGFEHKYGLFAEWLLAATLHQRGYRLDYAPGVGVRHLECEDFSRLYADIKLFVDGECLYRQENNSRATEHFFGAPPEWNQAKALNRFSVARLLQPLWQQLISRQGISATAAGWWECLRQTFENGALALWGKRQLLIKHHWLVWWAHIRCMVISWNEELRYRAFIDYYDGLVTLFRIQYALAAPVEDTPNRERLAYPILELPDAALFGFHGLEVFKEETFRWSAVVSAIRICLDDHNYRGMITLLKDVRHPLPDTELSLYLNQQVLKIEAFNLETSQLTFNLPESALAGDDEQWLIIMCKPWRFDGLKFLDHRALGLPIVYLEFKPIEETVS